MPWREELQSSLKSRDMDIPRMASILWDLNRQARGKSMQWKKQLIWPIFLRKTLTTSTFMRPPQKQEMKSKQTPSKNYSANTQASHQYPLWRATSVTLLPQLEQSRQSSVFKAWKKYQSIYSVNRPKDPQSRRARCPWSQLHNNHFSSIYQLHAEKFIWLRWNKRKRSLQKVLMWSFKNSLCLI